MLFARGAGFSGVFVSWTVSAALHGTRVSYYVPLEDTVFRWRCRGRFSIIFCPRLFIPYSSIPLRDSSSVYNLGY